MNEKKENVIVNGFFWRFAERCGVQLISAVVSILLARILTPDDYGKVALVTVFNNIMYVLLDCGIGTALVQKKEVDELDYSSAFFFSIVISFVLYGGMFVAAPYLAAFYNDPSMTPIFRGISLTVAVCGIKTIQQAHVTRNMKFQYFFYSAFAGAIVSTVLGLGLAYMGFGVWALVVQQVSNITVDTLVLWKLSSWRPKMEFSWQHLKGLLSYGWKLLASSLSSVIYNNLRSLIIGKMYTSADLAYYNQGDNLTYNIASSVDTSIESVLFPVMSSLQDDRAQVKNMTRRSISYLREIVYGLRKAPYLAVLRMEHNGQTSSKTPWMFKDNLASWTWPGFEGQTASVDVYSASEEVELFLNGASLGRRTVVDFTATYSVPYAPGELKAVGYTGGVCDGEFTLRTAQDAQLTLTADRKTLQANGEDAAFVMIQFVDANGTADLHAKHTLKVELEGAGILEAVGSANPCSEERYDTPESETFDGCCMAVIRAGEAAGEIHLTVTADDSVQKQLTILVQKAEG